jgi:hypothetical protein
MLPAGPQRVYNTGMFSLKTAGKFYYYTHT